MVFIICGYVLGKRVGKPSTLLAEAGYAGKKIVRRLKARRIDPLIAMAGQQGRAPL